MNPPRETKRGHELEDRVREEEMASENRQRKREREETNKVKLTPGATGASLRRVRATLIGPTQGLPERRRLCR